MSLKENYTTSGISRHPTRNVSVVDHNVNILRYSQSDCRNISGREHRMSKRFFLGQDVWQQPTCTRRPSALDASRSSARDGDSETSSVRGATIAAPFPMLSSMLLISFSISSLRFSGYSWCRHCHHLAVPRVPRVRE